MKRLLLVRAALLIAKPCQAPGYSCYSSSKIPSRRVIVGTCAEDLHRGWRLPRVQPGGARGAGIWGR